MTDPAPFPDQKALRLRARIRPVTRINRRVLVGGGLIVMLGIGAALTAGLAPSAPRPEAAPDIPVAAAGQRAPEALRRLPASYDGLGAPPLGAPTTGDLGGTIVAEEKAWGIAPDWDVPPSTDFRPSDLAEAERARRLAEAKLADAASRSGLFFEVSGSSRPAGAADEPAAPRWSAADELMALANGAGAAGALPAPAQDANLQARKSAFAGTGPETTVNPHGLEAPASPFMVMAGSVVPAALLTALNSDLPGTVTAQVTQPVFDTVSGAHLLIPQGARLVGRYQSEVSFGQDRALVVWDRIVFPDGFSIRISEPGSDAAGAAGIAGRTDHHWDRAFAAAGLATLLSISAEAGDAPGSEIERALRRGFGDSVSRTGERVVERSLAVQPTIRIAAGTPVRVLVTRDLVLRPYAFNP